MRKSDISRVVLSVVCIVIFAASGTASADLDGATAGAVGLSGASDLDAFVPANAQSETVADGADYDGLTSYTEPVERAAGTSPGGPYDTGLLVLGSTATLLDGTNTTGTSQTVTMNWRNRADSEDFETAVFNTVGGPVRWYEYGPASDVVEITGLEGSTFVLQLTYNEDEIVEETVDGVLHDEQYYAENGWNYVGWLNPDYNDNGSNQAVWVNAVEGNTGGILVDEGVNRTNGFKLGAYDSLTDLALGKWGCDPTENVVWAVLNHNSQYSGVPEPATMTLLCIGGLAVLRRRRRQ